MTRKKFAVVGDPISHSKSPNIHNFAYKFFNLDVDTYSAHRVPAGGLVKFTETNHFDGLSVTMPLKFEAYDLAGDRDSFADRTLVCNTLSFANGLVSGRNTDVFGIRKSLETRISEEVSSVSILGTGATARSAILAIEDLYPNCSVTVYGRSPQKLLELRSLNVRNEIGFRSFIEMDPEHELVINTVPNLPNKAHIRSDYTLDVAYSEVLPDWSTGLLISGKEMLVWQACEQLRTWFFAEEKQLPMLDEFVSEVFSRSVLD